MTARAIEIVWWVLGTFGLAGLVAFWFLAPTAAQLTLQAVVRVFKLLLSYRIGCALLAAIAAGLIVDHKRHAYDDQQFAARTAAFEDAQHQRDGRIAQETRDKVLADIANATSENAVIEKDVKEFSDALPAPAPTGNPFLVGADADRLCRIAGKTQCGPSGDQGMPKARRPGGRSGNHAKIRLPSLIRTGTWADKQGQ
jgi:hypothetical protein